MIVVLFIRQKALVDQPDPGRFVDQGCRYRYPFQDPTYPAILHMGTLGGLGHRQLVIRRIAGIMDVEKPL
jgi:hypothetical protein